MLYMKIMHGNIAQSVSSYSLTKNLLDYYLPPEVLESENYQNWITIIDIKTCPVCLSFHGKIFDNSTPISVNCPVHDRCRCSIEKMKAVKAGNGTKDGKNGADYWIMYRSALPEYYISKDELVALGWKAGRSPAKFAKDKMLTKGEYENRDGKLPQKIGRVWYEADINYYSGRRNGHRILWSNDGLIFITYNHYQTF